MENIFRKKFGKRTYQGIDNAKLYKYFIAACFAMYLSMMIVKNVFTAEIVSIMNHYQTNKAQTSLANTFYYITYAITQMILVLFYGRMDIKKYLLITIPLSGILYVLIAFLNKMEALWVIFAINGILQAGIWSGTILLLSNYLPEEMISLGNGIMSQGSNLGAVLSYAICSIFVSFGAWQFSFILFGIILLLSVVFFGVVTNKVIKNTIKKTKSISSNKSTLINHALFSLNSKGKKILFYCIAFILLILLNCMYYGIMGWIVDFLKTNFNIAESFSMILAIFVPLISILGPIIAISVCDRYKNFVKNYLIFAFLPLILLVIMIFTYNKSLIFSLICLMLIIISVKIMTTISNVVSFNMRFEINSGSFSSFINAGAAIAAGVMPTIIGKLIDTTGNYQVQFVTLSIICFVMLIITAITYFLTKNKVR